jgi:sugar phosphate isomerase/epimerase
VKTADLIAEIGYDGIECPVRKNGQILPDRVEEDLPKMHDALSRRGLALTLITTDIAAVNPLNEKVLRTAARLGVKRYRLTSFHYDLTKPIPPQLANLRPALRELAALNRELGISGGIQNHSGSNYIGAALWDLHQLMSDVDPVHLGVCFDIGHATIEGGYSWPIQAKLIEPLLQCVYVKDFAWEKRDNAWKAEWRPLGEGTVSRKFFSWLKSSSYHGPISQHCEYLHGSGPEQRAQMKKDLAVLKGWLAA